MKNNHSFTRDLLECIKFCTKKKHAPYMRMDLNVNKKLPENLKPEF